MTESSCGNCGHTRSCHEDDECWADITPVGEGSYEQCPCGWWDDPDASEPPRFEPLFANARWANLVFDATEVSGSKTYTVPDLVALLSG